MIHVHKRGKVRNSYLLSQLRKSLEHTSRYGSQHQGNDHKEWENPPKDSHQLTFNYLPSTSLVIN